MLTLEKSRHIKEDDLSAACALWFSTAYPSIKNALLVLASHKGPKESKSVSRGYFRMLLMLPTHTHHGVWIDVKRPGSTRTRMTASHKAFIAECKRNNYQTFSVKTLKEFTTIIESCVYRHIQYASIIKSTN